MNIFKMLMASLFLVSACSSGMHSPEGVFPQALSPQPWEETAIAAVSVDPQDIPLGQEAGDVLQKKGLRQGVDTIFNRWMAQRLIFQEETKVDKDLCAQPFVRQEAPLQALQNEVTDIFSLKFELQATFAPCASFQGRIMDLENERSIVSTLDQVLITGGPWLSRSTDSFFLVGRPLNNDGRDVMRLIGSGQIFHVLGDLAQGRIMETNQEIKEGDRVFPVWVQSTGIKAPAPEPSAQENVSEVMVEPKPVPEPEWTAPAEPK